MSSVRAPSAARRQQQAALLGALLLAALAPRSARSEPPSTTGVVRESLASFDNGQITRDDYERVLAQKSRRELELVDKPGGREALLEQLLRYDLLAGEAVRRGYAQRLEVRIAGHGRASEAMLAALITVDRSKISVAEVDRAYAERHHEFGRPRMRRATLIRVASETEAKVLIAQLQGRAREQFARVAREKNSDARTRHQGGELGYFDGEGKTVGGRPADVPPALVRAAFAFRRVGEVSDKPIAHDGAWSVLMLTGEMLAITKSRAELDPILREQLAVKQEQRALDMLETELRARYSVELHPELIESIVLPPSAPLDMPEGFAAAPRDPRAPPILLEPDGI